jgi:hypothetical protein
MAAIISDALPFGRLWYGEPNAVSNATDNAKFYSRSHDAVIRVYDEAGNAIETHEHAGDFKEPWMPCFANVLPCSFFDGCSLYGARNRLQDAV